MWPRGWPPTGLQICQLYWCLKNRFPGSRPVKNLCFLGHPDCDIWFWLPGERTQSALQEIFLNCIFQQLSEIYIYLLSHLIFLRLLFCALNIPFTITSCTCFKDAVSFPLPLRTLTGSFHLPVFMFLQFLYLQASLSSRLEVCLGICLLIFRSKSRKREIWS